MQAWVAVPALLLAIAMAGCGDADRTAQHGQRNNTAVLGGYGPGGKGAAPPLTDAAGQAIPPPPAPAQADVQAVRLDDDAALAVWLQDGPVVASAWTRAFGWSAPQPLERIYGTSSDPQLASNGRGAAMALWHHRVGNIHSLRFSRFDAATGWSPPDVLPGALPRPNVSGRPITRDAAQMQMDAEGNVTARWPSGFRANEMQTARHVAGQGWTRAAGEPVAAAPDAAAPSAPALAR